MAVSPVAAMAVGVSVSIISTVGVISMVVGTSVSVETSVGTVTVGVLVGGVPQADNTPSNTATNKSNRRFFSFLSPF